MAGSRKLEFDEASFPEWDLRIIEGREQGATVPEDFDLSTLVAVNAFPPGHARRFTAEELQELGQRHRAIYGLSLLKVFAARGVPEHLEPTKSYYLVADRGLVSSVDGHPSVFVLDGPAVGSVEAEEADGADEEVTGDWSWDTCTVTYTGGDELWLLTVPEPAAAT